MRLRHQWQWHKLADARHDHDLPSQCGIPAVMKVKRLADRYKYYYSHDKTAGVDCGFSQAGVVLSSAASAAVAPPAAAPSNPLCSTPDVSALRDSGGPPASWPAQEAFSSD